MTTERRPQNWNSNWLLMRLPLHTANSVAPSPSLPLSLCLWCQMTASRRWVQGTKNSDEHDSCHGTKKRISIRILGPILCLCTQALHSIDFMCTTNIHTHIQHTHYIVKLFWTLVFDLFRQFFPFLSFFLWIVLLNLLPMFVSYWKLIFSDMKRKQLFQLTLKCYLMLS